MRIGGFCINRHGMRISGWRGAAVSLGAEIDGQIMIRAPSAGAAVILKRYAGSRYFVSCRSNQVRFSGRKLPITATR
jgi:hypothetical protein